MLIGEASCPGCECQQPLVREVAAAGARAGDQGLAGVGGVLLQYDVRDRAMKQTLPDEKPE